MRTLSIAIALFFSSAFVLPKSNITSHPYQTITWKLEDTTLIGNFHPVILGHPMVVKDIAGASLSFNGINDGLIIPKIPIEGWPRFTIEVLFKPAGDFPSAPRFFHFQDTDGNRGTIELRVTAKGNWYLDTFLKNGKTGKGLTLIDSTKQHEGDKWYWAALAFDGKKMTSYVNAVKELEGEVNFEPMTRGQISLGVRLNKVNWFKGQIREIQFHPTAIDPSALRKNL